MTPGQRRDLTLAFIELAGTFHPVGSPERDAWAEMWDQARALDGKGIDESRLVPGVVYAMRAAAKNLQRAVDQYGPDGWATAVYDEQAAQLAELSDRMLDRAGARGFTEKRIRRVTQQVRVRFDRHPTREEVAAALNTSVPTLKRAMRELNMGKWPPAPPEDDPI